VGLERVEPEQAESQKLKAPISFQLFGEGIQVAPNQLHVVDGGPAGFQTAWILLAHHGDEGKITALSDFGNLTYVVKAAAELAAVRLSLDLTSILGLGMGSAKITATRAAEDGLDLNDPRDLLVSLTATGGRLAQPTLSIKAHQSRSETIEFRSAGLGDVELAANAGGLHAAPVKVTFTTPWYYLIAIIVGAIIGGTCATVLKQQKFGWRFVGRCLAGVLAAVAGLVGFGWAGLVPTISQVTEAGCLVVGALGAYGGDSVLDWMLGKVIPPKRVASGAK
jgi:uncharacterized membrane protein YeaQ/YmgE (transglycosylase-associated protein family)